ncbi:glutathione S-transferase [Marivita sp. S0852]|uniref:glutathione S-transferase n=1 Tax=Marivita sp. S0852 TaxID=3373893 RepID=UPI0039821259
MVQDPVLWSFRRCPYAMRARLAVLSAGVRVELREILLRDKPDAFVQTSPSATVPCLAAQNRIIDESLDIMIWALKQNDPDRLLEMPDDAWGLIEENDGPFKLALDHTKYAMRYPDLDRDAERHKAETFLFALNQRLAGQSHLFANRPTLADYAIFPFVRQFANIDRNWFDAQPWPNLAAWLSRFTESSAFDQIMIKHPPWSSNAPPTWFGA